MLAIATNNHDAVELSTVELAFRSAHQTLQRLQFFSGGFVVGDVVAEQPHHPALVADAGNAIEVRVGNGHEGDVGQATRGDGFGEALVGGIGEGVLVGEGQAGVEAGVHIQQGAGFVPQHRAFHHQVGVIGA